MWPSTDLAEIAIARLRTHDHPHRFEHLRYEGAGHLITVPGAMPLPDDPDVRRFVLGATRERNEAASRDT